MKLAMAATGLSSLPFPLLFDYLLASSWAWLVLCLATLATACRALKIPLPGLRLKAPTPSTAADSHSLSSSSLDSPAAGPVFCGAELPAVSFSRCRRRTRCKSMSSLHSLNRNGEDLLRSGMELVSSVLDADILPSLRKRTSASKLFGGQCKSDEKTSWNLRCPSGTEGYGEFDGCLMQPKSHAVAYSDDIKTTFVQKYDVSSPSSVHEEHMCSGEDIVSSLSWLPSWAYSLCCEPWQKSLFYRSPASYTVGNFSEAYQYQASPGFEKQFGWDNLLETRLGLSWNCIVYSMFGPTRCKVPEVSSPEVVKKWAGQQRQLLKALSLDEGSALSLDFTPENGMASVGSVSGEVMLWDVASKVCVTRVATKGQPVYASTNSGHGFTVFGDGGGVTLWDQRSSAPLSIQSNIVSSNVMLNKGVRTSALKSRRNGLCIAQPDGVLSMYDVRNLHSQPVSSGKWHQGTAKAEDETPIGFLGMLASNCEEDFCDGDEFSPRGNESPAQKRGSFVSRLASFLQGMYTSGS